MWRVIKDEKKKGLIARDNYHPANRTLLLLEAQGSGQFLYLTT